MRYLGVNSSKLLTNSTLNPWLDSRTFNLTSLINLPSYLFVSACKLSNLSISSWYPADGIRR